MLNTTATTEMIESMKPYAVIIATGSTPIKPGSIAGINGTNVYTPVEILSGQVTLKNQNVCIVGSGLTGLETGEFLAAENNVIIFEAQDKIGSDAFPMVVMDITSSLTRAGVRMIPGHKLLEIKADRIILEDKANIIIEQPCDAVIISLGICPLNELVLKDIPNVFTIGDAHAPGRIAQAVAAGFEVAYNLQ